jgi:hypothetical protein
MTEKFHQRFNIEVDLDEARRRFDNRVHHNMFHIYWAQISDSYRDDITREVLSSLGEKYKGSGILIDKYIGNDFYRNLEAIEYLYETIGLIRQGILSYLGDKIEDVRNNPDHPGYRTFRLNDAIVPDPNDLIKFLLNNSEVDLEIRWQDGQFVTSGASELDESLVNEPLQWLSGSKYEPVRTPFEKGLRHFLYSPKRPELLSDVITDMYEALEALAKIMTNRPTRELSAIQEQFLSQVKASLDYKQLLKDYIFYANRFRHALKEGSPKPNLSPKEAESFIYLTGLFIRLAMP